MNIEWKYILWMGLLHVITCDPNPIANLVTENMNGEYLIANPNTNAENSFSTLYSKYPNIEHFEVYTPPISTR